MATPFKIVVLADLAPGRPAEKPLKLDAGGVDGLLARLSPGLKLGDPVVDITFKKLEDFTPPSVSKGRAELEQDPQKLTSVIHHPGFMALESAWRGLDFLARRLPGEGVEVYVLNTPEGELRQRLYDQVFKPEYDGMTEHPAGLILLDFDFDHKPASLAVLKDLAKMGAAIQAPLAAQTTASFFGLSHLLHLLALSDLDRKLMGPEYASFLGFREKDEASWLSLCLNRFLLRPPFEGLGYQEPASAAHPEQYLWGRGVWMLGANVARAWGSFGQPIDISGMGNGEQRGLPTRELPITRKEKIQTPLEAMLPQPLVEALPYFGLSPITQLPAELGGSQQPDMAYLHLAANLRHFTDPTGSQPGLLLVYATLAYSLVLGRAGNLALRIAPELAGLSQSEAVELLKRRLTEELGAMAEGELTVTPGEGGLEVSLKPELKIHSKEFKVEFSVPFGG